MCGITGAIGFTDHKKTMDIVRRMNDCIAHRGPDAAGVWGNDDCVLGHRRLSIIDTSEAGNQPFFSEDKKIVVAFNGEIYNYIELKKELSAAYTFKTQTDTEVIIAAYRKWGIDCIHHFFGMFALALWDEDKKSLYIVRDRLGIKPVYYAATSDGIYFASEIRAILSTGKVEKKISKTALADYFRYQTVHAPETIIDGVKMLMPGHYIKVTNGKMEIVTFWDQYKNMSREGTGDDLKTVRKNIRDILHSAVEIRMRADVPFGAFLSGGIDSGIIVGLMSEVSSHPVKTFSITFHEKEYDESPYSELISKKFRTDHTPIQLSANDFLNLIPDALNAMDHPSGDGPNTFVVSKVTREKGVKMALSGLGGDEVFAGYEVFRRVKSLESKEWISKIPATLRSTAGKFYKKARPSVASEKLAEFLGSMKMDFAHFYPLNRQVLPEAIVNDLLKGDQTESYIVETLASVIQDYDIPLLSKVSIAEMSSYMQNTLLRDTDQMSMAHALEVRVPFLDHRLIEYVLGVRDNHKYPHSPKELLTSSVAGLIPDEVIHRPKMGFTFPWAVWMRNELQQYCADNIASLEKVEAINYSNVKKLWERFLMNDPMITWSRIWPLVVLGHWVNQHDAH